MTRSTACARRGLGAWIDLVDHADAESSRSHRRLPATMLSPPGSLASVGGGDELHALVGVVGQNTETITISVVTAPPSTGLATIEACFRGRVSWRGRKL